MLCIWLSPVFWLQFYFLSLLLSYISSERCKNKLGLRAKMKCFTEDISKEKALKSFCHFSFTTWFDSRVELRVESCVRESQTVPRISVLCCQTAIDFSVHFCYFLREVKKYKKQWLRVNSRKSSFFLFFFSYYRLVSGLVRKALKSKFCEKKVDVC